MKITLEEKQGFFLLIIVLMIVGSSGCNGSSLQQIPSTETKSITDPQNKTQTTPIKVETIFSTPTISLINSTQTPSPQSRLIAFTSIKDGYPAVYTIFSDGSALSLLTDSPAESYDPAWSPDGSKIAFLSGSYSEAILYVREFESGNQILFDYPGIHHFSWSPDGKMIAFAVEPPLNGQSIPTGSELDSAKIYIASMLDSDASFLHQIDSVILDLDWLPTSDQLLILELGDNLVHLDLDGNASIIPTSHSPSSFDLNASGELIAIDGFNRATEKHSKIEIIDFKGSLIREISSSGTYLYDPQWSPDGTMLAYRSHIFSTTFEGPIIRILNLDNGDEIQVSSGEAHSRYPSWSPSGNFLLFLRDNLFVDEKWQSLNIFSIETNQVVELINEYVMGYRPVWRP